ncbi:MAG: hypothetical protein GC164_01910 [Phycisphaera sp.]|nr:hypothetical protein [Phycisphaera sp.]
MKSLWTLALAALVTVTLGTFARAASNADAINAFDREIEHASSLLDAPDSPTLAPLLAQVVNPATDAANRDRKNALEAAGSETTQPVIVEGQRDPNKLNEEQLVGSYNQPVWTAKRRFSATRVYVRPEGTIEAEYWFIAKIRKHGGSELIHQAEIELGLPYRLQLDLYGIFTQVDGKGDVLASQAIELRWALADWDVIPGNPTFYVELINNEDAPEVIELKLLLGGEITTRWHWGANLVWERQLSGSQENEYELTTAVSYTLIDNTFSIGAEGKFSIGDAKGTRGHFANSENIRIGPSVQWKSDRFHADIAPLFGVTTNSRVMDLFVVLGWEF